MTTSPLSFQLSSLGPDDAAACADMTFPAYRHLLALTPALRLPAEPEQRPVTAFGVVARVAGVPVGLVLAEWPQQMESGPPEVLSLFVRASVRGHGLGRALLTAIAQDAIERRGASVLEAVYTTGKPSIPVLEHLFAQLGWDPPERRSLTVRFTPAEARATPWYGRTGLLPEGATMFPWAELTVAERHQLMTSNAAAPWIPNSLQPWRHDGVGFDPVSSVGLRYGGAVVGWVINHQVDARTVRFTCSFMRKDLSRRARILPLYSESIRRLSETSCELCTLITPTAYPGMTGFIHRHIAPYASFTGETRGTRTRGHSGAGR